MHWQREQLDCLVNNAGIGIHASFADTSEAQFDQLMNIHLKGPFFLTQALLPLLADGGRILNLSSGLTRFSQPGYAAYASMKGGVEVLTRYLARELGARGIRVNTLAPGAIETDFAGGLVRDNPHINAQLAAHTALGRVGLPEDIGAMAAALLSDEAGWMTAQRVEASGGLCEALLLKRFSEIILADLAADFVRRHMAARHQRRLRFAGLFTATRTAPASALAEAIGCARILVVGAGVEGLCRNAASWHFDGVDFSGCLTRSDRSMPEPRVGRQSRSPGLPASRLRGRKA